MIPGEAGGGLGIRSGQCVGHWPGRIPRGACARRGPQRRPPNSLPERLGDFQFAPSLRRLEEGLSSLADLGLLVLAVGLVFGQTVGHEFIGFDDQGFVHENPHVKTGLTLEGLRWALTEGPTTSGVRWRLSRTCWTASCTA